jgi:hypothetical protein
MKTSKRTRAMIGMWIIVTALVAIISDSTTLLAIVSSILFVAWVVSLFIDNMK